MSSDRELVLIQDHIRIASTFHELLFDREDKHPYLHTNLYRENAVVAEPKDRPNAQTYHGNPVKPALPYQSECKTPSDDPPPNGSPSP